MEFVYYIVRNDLYWNGHTWRRKEFATGMTEAEAHEIVERRFSKLSPPPFIVSVRIAKHLIATQVREKFL